MNEQHLLFMRNTILFLFCVAFCSCQVSRYVAAPTTFSSPFITKKGHLNASAHFTISNASSVQDRQDSMGIAKGADLMTHYNICDNLYVFGVHSFRDEHDFRTQDAFSFYDIADVRYRRSQTDIGIGFNKKASFGSDVIEALDLHFNTLIGKGTVRWDEILQKGNSNTFRSWNASLLRLGIECSIQATLSERFKLSYVNRFLLCSYNVKSSNYSYNEKAELYLINNERFFIESGFQGYYRLKKVPVFFIGQLSLGMGERNAMREGFMSIGAGLDLRLKKK